jgi:hypothetical protein
MKLGMVMNQSKGLMGGVSFELKGRIELTPDEQQLVRHYKLEGETLTKQKLKNIWGQLTDTEISISVGMLLRGDTFKCKNLGEVIAYRDSLVDGCRNLKAYLDVAKSFGGEVVIDIDELVQRGSNRGDDQDV